MERSARAETILWIADETVSTNTPGTEEAGNPRLLFAPGLTPALDILARNPIDAIVLRLPLAGCAPEELVKALHAAAGGALLLIYEPSGGSYQGDELIRLGASYYISDAVPPQELRQLVAVAIRG